jgi:putative sugar O-methyltransferase
MKNVCTSIKETIKLVSPPIVMSAYRYFVQFVSKHKSFELWWKEYSNKKNLPSDLISMVDYFITTPSFKASSIYWNWLNQKNIQQISDSGYENFKQIIARNYFTWVGGLDTPYTATLLKNNNIDNLSIDCPLKEILRKHTKFTLEESVIHNIITILLLDYVNKNGGDKYVRLLEEPSEGNPPAIELQGKRISQDLLNSILDFLAISRGCDLGKVSTILELGAGSGRTAFCLLKLLPSVKYIVVDVPPALFISQTYLSNSFPDKKIFSFRPFKSFKAVQGEFKSSDIIFLMPDQLDLLPDKMIDLFIAIDCLHEMKKEQVDLYFDHVDRLANHFFFKCWKKTTVPFDDITYLSEDYPVRNNWHEVYKAACDVPSTYFEAFYQIKDPPSHCGDTSTKTYAADVNRKD